MVAHALPPDADALVKKASEAEAWLELHDNNLGALPTEAMQALAGAIGRNTSITELGLSSNGLGALPTEAMQALAGAIGSNTSIT
jgi:hypothetical protein